MTPWLLILGICVEGELCTGSFGVVTCNVSFLLDLTCRFWNGIIYESIGLLGIRYAPRLKNSQEVRIISDTIW